MILSIRDAWYDLWWRESFALKSVKIEFDRFIHLDLAAFMRFCEIDWFKSFLEAFATVFVRVFYSYEVDIKNLNRLLSKITVSWLRICDEIVWVQQRHYFELIFWLLLQLIMQDFLRQCLMITSAMLVAKSSLLLLLVAYEHSTCELVWMWSRRSFVIRLYNQLL